MLERVWHLAHWIHPYGQLAARIVAEALCYDDTTYPQALQQRQNAKHRQAEDRARDRQGPGTRAGGENTQVTRAGDQRSGEQKRVLPPECRLQYAVYCVSQRWEKDQEGPQREPLRYTPTPDDYQVRYLEFLIWKTLERRPPYFLAGALGCLVHTYPPQAIGTIVTHFWERPWGNANVPRVVNGYWEVKQGKREYRRGIRAWVLQRFQPAGLVVQEEDTWIPTGVPNDHQQRLIQASYRQFTPWDSPHVRLPPAPPPRLERTWNNTWYEARQAWAQRLAAGDWFHALHALIDPECFGFPRWIETYTEESPHPHLLSPGETLRMPLFQPPAHPSTPNGENRFEPPPFSPVYADLIRQFYDDLRRRRKAGGVRSLRVYVDGAEQLQFRPSVGSSPRFDVPLEASCVEVLGEDAAGTFPLTLFLVPDLADDDQECQLVVRLEGGHILTLQLTPVRAATGDGRAVRCQVAYAEAVSQPQPAAREPLGARVERWLSEWWPPLLAGREVTAAAAPAEDRVLPLADGSIRVTCEWWSAEPGQPVLLRIAWRAHITRQGEFWIRFTHRDDPGAVLSEHRLGNRLVGEQVFSGQDLGFDPTRLPWALVVFLQEPQA